MTYLQLAQSLSAFLPVDEEKMEKLKEYASLIVTSNQKFNLTAILEENDIIIKHFYDSLFPLSFFSIEGKKVLDFGSGAGLPGIPFALFTPSAEVTLLDATKKKCDFLLTVKERLSLQNVEAIHGRGEDMNKRESFDCVSARAVASLSVLLELVAPLLKVGGYFLALKGKGGEEELFEAKGALKALGLSLFKEEEYELPEGKGSRVLLVFKKEKATPKRYPRPYADILKRPL